MLNNFPAFPLGAILDELVVPGNNEEIAEFVILACKMCLTQVDISLPKATVLLPSKQFFETIYNRLSTDLCLWEPSAPEYFASTGKPFHEAQNVSNFNGLGSAVLQTPIPDMFIMCKSGVAYGKSRILSVIVNFFMFVYFLLQNQNQSRMKVAMERLLLT